MSTYIHTRPVKDEILSCCLDKELSTYSGSSGALATHNLTTQASFASQPWSTLDTSHKGSEPAIAEDGKMFPIFFFMWPLQRASPGGACRNRFSSQLVIA